MKKSWLSVVVKGSSCYVNEHVYSSKKEQQTDKNKEKYSKINCVRQSALNGSYRMSSTEHVAQVNNDLSTSVQTSVYQLHCLNQRKRTESETVRYLPADVRLECRASRDAVLTDHTRCL